MSYRVKASPEGLKKLNAIRDANKWSYRQIADIVLDKTSDALSEDRIMAFFKGENIYKSNALLICNALGFEADDIIENHAKTTNKNDINWTEKCKEILIYKRELAINLFTSDMGVTIEFDQIHVPLGLISRKEKSKIAEDFETEKDFRIYQNPSEDKILYSIFENEVLPEFKSSSNRIISILGEAGSGKTVQLLKIAQWILEQGDLPIFISLGSIQIKENIKEVKPLLDYLFDDWLKQFFYQVPNQWRKDLEFQLQQGKVWLLLDGADEIVGYSDPLGYLSKSLSIPLFQNVKVIVTCRSNLWEIGANALASLSNKTYKMMRFEYGDNNLEIDTVSQFIDQWFKNSNPDIGKTLRQALDEPAKEQIRDLVTHPLMLSLLCFSWQYLEGKLPDTRASLYKNFSDAIYKLKEDKIFVNTSDKLQLEKALGKLALESIGKGYKSFLPYELVYEFLEKPYSELFELAIKLNLLNDVGTNPNTRQSVYAFFHPSFQAYFAALAIDKSIFWLNHIPENPHNGSYRIIEKKWEEVFFLWLGCSNLYEEKTNLYNQIINFDCGCEDIYKKKLFTLASIGLNEFNYQNKEKLIADTIDITLSITRHPDYTLDYVDWSIDELYVIEKIPQINDKIVKKILLAKLESETQKNWTYLIILCALLRVDINDKKILNLFVDFLSERLEYEIIDANLGYSFLSENFRHVLMVKCRYYDYQDKYLDHSFRDLAMEFIQAFLSNFKPKQLSEDNSFYIFKKLFDRCLELDIKYLSFGLIQHLELDIRYLSFGLLISSSDLIFNTLFSVISLPNLGQQHEKNVFLFFSYLDIYQERFAPNDCTVFCSLLYIKERILNNLEVSLSVINYLDALLSQKKYSIFIKEHQDYLDSLPF